jgi:hypothetical protein
VQRVYDGIASGFLPGVGRREEDEDVPIDRVAFQVTFQRGAVDLYPLHGDRLGTGHDGGHLGLDLRGKLGGCQQSRKECPYSFTI